MKQDEREDCIARFQALDWPGTAQTIRQLRAKKADYEDKIKNINERLKIMCIEVVPDKMAEQGLAGVPLADGGRIELRPKAYCSVRAGKKPDLEDWLHTVEAADLIQPTVNASTLKAFCKERLSHGEEIPEDIINYQPFVEATLIKGR
jgi:hypothetical protein